MYRGGVTGNRFEMLTIIKENIPRSKQATMMSAEWNIQLLNQLAESFPNRYGRRRAREIKKP